MVSFYSVSCPERWVRESGFFSKINYTLLLIYGVFVYIFGESSRLGIHKVSPCDRGFACGECAPTRLYKYTVGAHSRFAGSREKTDGVSFYSVSCPERWVRESGFFSKINYKLLLIYGVFVYIFGESSRLGIHKVPPCDRGFA